MPKVPVSNNIVPLLAQAKPSPTDFAMAAAMMHEEGRLFEFPTTEKYSTEVRAIQNRERNGNP